ncbi:hypothetical protein [Flavobacterium sp.]|uniref:hypothetical protein n=1 Tax=Flavobacterium sp. TaxID=239 RepID=UPI0022BEB0B4|nr:hypothetical protein [Flavobacterium sp.]MCZ8089714.1 hypothetical protein [Flavobacterium sp.]
MKKTNTFNNKNFCFFNKAMFILIFIAFCSGNVYSQNGQFVLEANGAAQVTIGSSSVNMWPAPFLPNRKDSRVQFLFEADELNNQGAYSSGYTTISSLAFHVSGFSLGSLSSYEMRNITISMGHTKATYNGDNSVIPAIPVWGITMPPPGFCTWAGSSTPEPLQVVKTPFNLTISQTGWVELQLDTPFVWNGVDSIVVEICKADPRISPPSTSFSTGRYQFTGRFHSQPSGSDTWTLTRSLRNINNNVTTSPGCNMQLSGGGAVNTEPALSTQYRKFRPNIRFTFRCAGAPTAGEAILGTENFCKDEAVTLSVVNDEKATGLNYQWYYSYADDDNYVSLPGQTAATIPVERAGVDIWYKRDVGCNHNLPAGTRSSWGVKVTGVNTWNGTSWSFGSNPLPALPVRIQGNFDTTVNGSLLMEACSLKIVSGTFTVRSGDFISLKEKLVVDDAATVIFENNASLIQENNAAVNEGKILYKRDSQPVRMLDYTYWSSPVAGVTPNQFSPGTPSIRIYHWNHLTQAWANGIANSPMTAGKGYIIRAPDGYPSTGIGTVFQGSFLGVPNNGLITVPSLGGSANWNLLGNPYPSALDANKFLLANSTLLDGTIFYWTHNTLPSAALNPLFPHISSYTSDDYATYNFTGSVGLPSISSGNNTPPGQFIGAGQSFMVKGGASSGNVVFNNDMRKNITGYSNSQFYRNNATNSEEVEKNRLWVEVIHQNGKFNQTMVGYVEGATDGLDWGYDSTMTPSGDLKIYTKIGDDKLVIQGKSLPFNSSDSIPLGFSTTLTGEFTLNLYQYDSIFENQSVYLLDNATSTFHDIKSGMYTFTSIQGTFDNRFELRFNDEALSLNPNIKTENSVLCYTNNSDIIVKSLTGQIQSVTIFDSTGRVLHKKTSLDTSEILISEIAKNNQLLLVQIESDNGVKVTKKIIF